MENILKQIKNICDNNKEGSFKINLNSKQKTDFEQMVKENKIRTEIFNYNNIRLLKLEDSSLLLDIINLKDFNDEVFNEVKKYIVSEKDIFVFSKDARSILDKYKNLSYYMDDIVEKIYKNYMENMRYKGYMISFKETEDGLALEKKFLAHYNFLIFKKNNMPYVKITKLKDVATMYRPNSRDYVYGDKDTNNVIICKYENADRFLECNDANDNFVVVDENSIDYFYAFDNSFFVNPTQKWVKKWWNYDAPDLYKYYPNKNGTKNMWGLCLICWRNTLVESNWNSAYIDEKITEKEVEVFAGEHKGTLIHEQMLFTLNKQRLSKEEKNEKIKEVENIEKRIQNIVDINKKDILFNTVMDFYYELKPCIEKQCANKSTFCTNDNELKEYVYNNFENEELVRLLSSLDGTFGFDCGFLYISTTGDTLKKFREVAEYDNSRNKNGALNLHLPWTGQSTTIQYKIGKHIKDVVEKFSNYNITIWTVLD